MLSTSRQRWFTLEETCRKKSFSFWDTTGANIPAPTHTAHTHSPHTFAHTARHTQPKHTQLTRAWRSRGGRSVDGAHTPALWAFSWELLMEPRWFPRPWTTQHVGFFSVGSSGCAVRRQGSTMWSHLYTHPNHTHSPHKQHGGCPASDAASHHPRSVSGPRLRLGVGETSRPPERTADHYSEKSQEVTRWHQHDTEDDTCVH